MVGVEPIPLGLLQDLMRHRSGLTVVNAYGTAETTVICAVFTVPRTGGDPLARTPIGTAVRGRPLAVIDESGALSADGHGELVAIGGCVARGYLGASGEAAARFFTWPDGERAYRTGDLVSTLPDGNIVFGGRADRQLKVRGTASSRGRWRRPFTRWWMCRKSWWVRGICRAWAGGRRLPPAAAGRGS